ncbi:MAG: 2,3-butanediol dehydrogenase [Chloroflexota bacterium]|nr:2,3-butanediol dehydrogenase [Chloroflexota bacterium]
MKAARWHARHDVRIEDVAEPSPKPGEVKIKVDYCGICGTDLHEYNEGPMFTAVTPHPLTGYSAPVIIGHEYSGTIVETGNDVGGWSVGDRVALEGYWICFDCHYCERHEYNRCEKLAFHGLSAPGGLAEFVCAPTYQLYAVDPRVSRPAASLIEPIAVAVRAVHRTSPKLGESALIVGAGPIGLAVLQVLRAAGIERIAVIEPARMRRELAREFGAALVLQPHDDLSHAVRDLARGVGFDMAFECAGVDAAFQTSMRGTRKGGRICILSQTNAPFQLNVIDLGFFEREIIGTVAYNGDFDTAIALIASGKVRADEMITATLPLDQLVSVGYQELMNNSANQVKIIVDPNA